MSTRFSDRAWEVSRSVRDAIDALGFLAELGEGTLAPAVFRHYLEQDALYLSGYARALALLAARAPDPGAAAFWARAAATTGAVEVSLHEDLLSDALLGGGERVLQPSPTCLGYVSYLIATAATAPYAVAAAAVLPCYWVYADVGRRLAARVRDLLAADLPHPYARWVAAYDAEEFQASAVRAREVVDAAAEADPGSHPAMLDAFITATRYEHLFWRAAHEREGWLGPQ